MCPFLNNSDIQTDNIPKIGHTSLIAILLVIWILAGCTEMPDVAQTVGPQPVGEIHGTRTVGQSFVAARNRLSRIDVQLATYGRRNTQPVTFHLRSGPSTSTDLATIVFNAEEVEDNAYRPFRFSPMPDSGGRSFYFFLESATSEPGDAVTLWHSPGDVYANGQMYIEGNLQGGDLAFKTFYTYGPGAILRDLYLGARAHAISIPLVVLLYLLPGGALLRLLHPDLDWGLSQRLVLSAGLTAALMPILLLIAYWSGLRLGRLAAALILVGAGVMVLWRVDPRRWLASIRQLDIVDASLGVVFLLVLAVRLLVARGLGAPLWVDSYHHTMISQLMIEHGGLFQSWEPYTPLRSFTYHFGFHAQAAFLHWVCGLSVVQSVILAGQLLNALTTLAVSFLTAQLTGSRWAGVLAALFAGAVSSLPMGYVNWGRYTQLAGQFILPFAIILTRETLRSETTNWRLLALTAITVAGLTLTHYGVLLFYICFLPTMLAIEFYGYWRRHNSLQAILSRFAVMGTGALLITAPWLWNISRGLLPRMVAVLVRIGPQSGFVRAHNALGNPFAYVDAPLLWLSILGGILGIILRNPGVILILLWVPFLFLLSNPYILHLPGTGIVNNFAVMISLYIPASVLSGWFVGRGVEAVKGRWPKAHLALFVSVFALAGAGSLSQLAVLDVGRMLVTKADEEAMVWIQHHTSPDAKFLVNADFPSYYDDEVVMGVDGGLWIPLLAYRETTVPPLLYGIEAPEESDHVIQINDFNRRIQSSSLDSPSAIRLLREHGVTHVYVSKQTRQMDPQSLVESSHYRQVYQKDGVWVFEVRPDSE